MINTGIYSVWKFWMWPSFTDDDQIYEILLFKLYFYGSFIENYNIIRRLKPPTTECFGQMIIYDKFESIPVLCYPPEYL